MYLGGVIIESADLDTESYRRIGAAWASIKRYNSQSYDRRDARLSLKIRPFKAEVETMLYGYPTWTICTQVYGSLRGTPLKLLFPRVVDFWRKGRTGYKPLSCEKALERTSSECIRTSMRKCQPGFVGDLIRQGDSRRLARIMFGRLEVKETNRGGRPETSWGIDSRNISRPSARSRAKAKDGNGSHSELLMMDGIG